MVYHATSIHESLVTNGAVERLECTFAHVVEENMTSEVTLGVVEFFANGALERSLASM